METSSLMREDVGAYDAHVEFHPVSQLGTTTNLLYHSSRPTPREIVNKLFRQCSTNYISFSGKGFSIDFAGYILNVFRRKERPCDA